MFNIKNLFFKNNCKYTKLPQIVHIISTYDNISEQVVKSLTTKYKIPKVVALKRNQNGNFCLNVTENMKFTADKIQNEIINQALSHDPQKKNQNTSNNLKFIQGQVINKQNLPDLIILCHDKLEFHLEQPELLYKAEIVHSRCCFSERLFEQAIKHYSYAVLNSGK